MERQFRGQQGQWAGLPTTLKKGRSLRSPKPRRAEHFLMLQKPNSMLLARTLKRTQPFWLGSFISQGKTKESLDSWRSTQSSWPLEYVPPSHSVE